MKKVVAFLLALIIFVVPVTTFVKADVVIGDNDETIINENANILGRKLALLESFSDLALSGVTEFTISNTNNIDTYLDSLWEELNDAIDSLSDGTGFNEISNTLKSRYYTNLIQYKDYITNRGDYLSQLLPSGSPTTTLLSTFFANNIYGKQFTRHYDLALDTFRALSDIRNHENVSPDPDFSFITNINNLYTYSSQSNNYVSTNFLDYNTYGWVDGNTRNFYSYQPNTPLYNHSYTFNPSISTGALKFHVPNSTFDNSEAFYCSISDTIIDINITTNQDESCDVTYTNANFVRVSSIFNNMTSSNSTAYNKYTMVSNYQPNGVYGSIPFVYIGGYSNNNYIYNFRGNYPNISTCINDIYNSFANVNVYVDGVPWALANTNNDPTLDIDGFLKIFGNNQPVQYELQPNTKIDYDQLYQVIYNAIRDNLPISQGDINYYDSHDTIYSPTIINNYGEEEGDESDLIDTILDYAVIPKFDTAIAQPMRDALNNGVVIMQNSITNVIPDEILLILGACFFLLLFAVVINRMIK